MKLYGLCRELGDCVCGLCAKIPPMGARAPRGKRKLYDPNDLDDDDDEDEPVIKGEKTCPDCGKRERSNHNCPAKQPPRPPKIPRFTKADRKGKQIVWEKPETASCGCLMHMGKRVRYCDMHFNERGLKA